MTSKIFAQLCLQAGIPEPVTEHRFGAEASGGAGKGLRKRLEETGLQDWRFDYAWPQFKVALEVEGGAYIGGRHTRGSGFVEDMSKYNSAAMLGWLVLRCIPRELCKVATVEAVKRAIQTRSAA